MVPINKIRVFSPAGVNCRYSSTSSLRAQAVVRIIEPITSPLASRILPRMTACREECTALSPVLLQGFTMSKLTHVQKVVILESYRAGHTLVLLDPTMQDIRALHKLIGEGITYRSINEGVLRMYALRKENNIPTSVLLHTRPQSIAQTGTDDEDVTYNGLLLEQAAQRILSELNHTVVQVNAAPPATQGQATTYTSGFIFNIGGTVNMSGVGLASGATWTNTTATTVPALDLLVSNQANEGVEWQFEYCTNGDEPGTSPHGTCTWHVQTPQGCAYNLGDTTGTNPQQGQTPNGTFSDAVQSVQWQQPIGCVRRVIRSTFRFHFKRI